MLFFVFINKSIQFPKGKGVSCWKVKYFFYYMQTRWYCMPFQNQMILFFFHDYFNLNQISGTLSYKTPPHHNTSITLRNFWNHIQSFINFSSHINTALTIKKFKFGLICSQYISHSFNVHFSYFFVYSKFLCLFIFHNMGFLMTMHHLVDFSLFKRILVAVAKNQVQLLILGLFSFNIFCPQ